MSTTQIVTWLDLATLGLWMLSAYNRLERSRHHFIYINQ